MSAATVETVPADVAGVVAGALPVALAAADAADAFTLPPFVSRDFSVDWKVNATEVTEIDREAERIVVDRLAAAFPEHLVTGEEHGTVGPEGSPWRWLVDPIDGTSGFVRGIPVWATLIGLTHVDHGAVLGVVSAPALQRRWWGALGDAPESAIAEVAALGVTRPLGVSRVDQFSDAQINITLNDHWRDTGAADALVELNYVARRTRGVGDFWQHMLVAEGAMDVAIDAIGVAPYDLAAVCAVVRAAGGTFTDRFGVPTHEHDSAVSSNGVLHSQIIDLLR